MTFRSVFGEAAAVELTDKHAIHVVPGNVPGFIYLDVSDFANLNMRIVVPTPIARNVLSKAGRVLAVMNEKHPPGTMQVGYQLTPDGVGLAVWNVDDAEAAASVVLSGAGARQVAQALLELADDLDRRDSGRSNQIGFRK